MVPVVFAVWLQVYDCGNFDIHSLGIHTADTTDTMDSTCMTIPWMHRAVKSVQKHVLSNVSVVSACVITGAWHKFCG